jgi:acetyl-CoA carboxylase biotin carboxyl carrier protein
MSKGIEQDVAFIQALAQLLRESDLTELEVEREGDELKVRLSRAAPAPGGHGIPGVPTIPATHLMPQPLHHHVAAPGAAAGAQRAEAGPDLSRAVTSPMVGTAYLAAEPGADPFVSIGDEVAEGDTILIIEAMKTMNQIPAPRAGRVSAILVDNAEPVEFGEPLMIID